jgi:hypothetical protein
MVWTSGDCMMTALGNIYAVGNRVREQAERVENRNGAYVNKHRMSHLVKLLGLEFGSSNVLWFGLDCRSVTYDRLICGEVASGLRSC